MIGRTVDRYRIVDELGRGGMGVVYKARDTMLDRFVALKLLPPERLADPAHRARFLQEAKAASALNHPGIVAVHDLRTIEGRDVIVMELVEGETLDERLARRRMTLGEALGCAIPLADALARAHAAGIVHRDLKPSNVMVAVGGAVKVLDFGLAKQTVVPFAGDDAPTLSRRETSLTAERSIVGTIAYMSPEQASGGQVDARSDIFAFGVLLRIGPRRLVSQGLDGAAPVPLLELSSGAILDADVSPDDRWLAVATGRPDGALSIRAVPLRGFPVPEAEWVRVAEPGYWVGRPRFSADGRLLYYLANRDGRTCLWAQHLDPATKRPRSDPFPVVHAHRSAMSRWGPRSGWALSVSRSRLVFNAAEMGGNVYTGMLGFVSE